MQRDDFKYFFMSIHSDAKHDREKKDYSWMRAYAESILGHIKWLFTAGWRGER